MLEIGRTYPKPELSLIFNTRDKQGLDRKLTRYGKMLNYVRRIFSLVWLIFARGE